ncbi:S26 family signal peptidase [Halobellus ruber]|uniref:S26 family signal peptidase n=1 Tax=Halobellus ruber TaxID=2761102 RepID=A0A7J9SK18_9EURY|nr:S26 family signal peptidase [Halobellus ruber]
MTDEPGDRNASEDDPTEGPDGPPSEDPDGDGPGAADSPGPAARDDTPRAADSRRERTARPDPEPGSRAARGGDESFLTRFRTARSGPLLFIRETLYSVIGVLAVGLLLFAVSGVWPPMVAVESGSMEPEMQRGDLIFVTEPERFTPDYARGGIVTVEVGTDEGYRSFGGNGSVIIYDPPDRVGSPIIHRAHFHVEEGENWYDRANPAYLNADDCESLSNCPAPHDGFITKGDANARYDQASNIAGPVRPDWIRGTARLRIPYLGYVRLELAGLVAA